MDPLFKNEAKAIIEIRAMLLKERPKVLGSEVNATFFISLKLMAKENLGLKPHQKEERI